MATEEKKLNESSVLYLDADTEITEAIEKLKNSKEGEVRIVAPSRSNLLHSSVNVKLLKKAAKDSNKQLILVTNDKIIKNLAGASGIAVASSVKAIASVPDVVKPKSVQEDELRIKEEDDSPSKSDTSKNTDSGFEPKHISLEESADEKEQEKSEKIKSESKKDKKIPDYSKLNKRIWLSVAGVSVVVLIILLYLFIPTGKVNVLAEAKKTSLNFNFILDGSSSTSDITAKTLAAQKLEVTKDINFDITATGKKEVGNKATGSVSVKNCDDVATHNLPAGTTMTGSGKSFVTAQAVTIPAGSAGGGVVNCSTAVDVQITATAPGESFNVSTTNFAISGYSSLYKATGSASGGTSKTVTVLSADDIANAKKQSQEKAQSARDDLNSKAGNDLKLFGATIQSNLVEFNASVAQDSEADKVSIASKVQYTGFAAKNEDVNKLFDEQVQDEIKGNKEVYVNGSDDGKYEVIKQFSPEKAQLNVKTSAYYGDPIDKKAIAKSVAGKSKNQVSDIVKTKGDQITGAQVETWPSLMPNMPILSGRITVDIKVSTN